MGYLRLQLDRRKTEGALGRACQCADSGQARSHISARRPGALQCAPSGSKLTCASTTAICGECALARNHAGMQRVHAGKSMGAAPENPWVPPGRGSAHGFPRGTRGRGGARYPTRRHLPVDAALLPIRPQGPSLSRMAMHKNGGRAANRDGVKDPAVNIWHGSECKEEHGHDRQQPERHEFGSLAVVRKFATVRNTDHNCGRTVQIPSWATETVKAKKDLFGLAKKKIVIDKPNTILFGTNPQRSPTGLVLCLDISEGTRRGAFGEARV